MKLAPRRPIRRLGVVGFLGLVFAGSGFAYVCHPDLPGTRRLSIQGRVDAYAMSGSRVTIDARISGCERRIDWLPLASSSSQSGCTDGSVGTAPGQSASGGRFRVVLEKGSVVPDRPDRLIVYDARTGQRLNAWPLPAPATSVDLARGVAVLSTSNGVFAVRVRDGQFALVGVKRRGDAPQIEAPGIVYQDDLYRRQSSLQSLLKFVPFASVNRTLRPSGPLRVPARIGDFSLDGRSVVFVKKDPAGKCDLIGSWSIPWHFSTNLMDEPPICPEKHARGGISALALGGQYIEVLTTYGGTQTLVSSTIVRCIEKVVTRTRLDEGSIGSLTADGGTLAYAVRSNGGPVSVGSLAGQQPSGSATMPSAVRLSVDRGRVAVLHADGSVDVRAGDRLLRMFESTDARAIALRSDQLVVLTRSGTLDVYALEGGALLHRWPVPPGTTDALDVHYGVAVLTIGRKVLAVSLATGRSRVLLKTPRPVRAQIDDVGVVYTYNIGRSGFLGFVPFAKVEAALAR